MLRQSFVLILLGITMTFGAQLPVTLDTLVGSDRNIFPISHNFLTKSTQDPAILTHLESLLSDSSILSQIYSNYLKKYEKTARKSTGESRENIFKNNLLIIAKHNLEAAAGRWKWTQGVNAFTDLTNDEFHSIYTRAPSPDKVSTMFGSQTMAKLNLTNSHVTQTSSLDWRAQGAVTPVKNQGDCGSCYAFASIAVAESRNILLTGQTLIFSEQELVDCSSKSNGYRNSACSGGNSPNSWTYMNQNGISLSKDYPYVSGNGQPGQCRVPNTRKYAKVNGFTQVPQNEDQLALAVQTYGPVSILINSVGWNRYKGGLYEGGCGTTYDGKSNHLVTVVGYTPDYWIIKNSWGTDTWGEQGFMYMQRGWNLCLINQQAFAITA